LLFFIFLLLILDWVYPHTNFSDGWCGTTAESEVASPVVVGISAVIAKIGVGVYFDFL